MQVKIQPVFATPVISTFLPDTQALNAELKSLFVDMMNNGQGNSTPPPTVRVNIFDSNMDLFDWENEHVQKLKKMIFTLLKEIIIKLNGYNENSLDKYEFVNDAWFHITKSGGYISSHVHSNASWSGVYYVDDGQPYKEHPDNGVIRFLDTRMGSNMFLDKANFALKSPFNSGSINFAPVPGMLVLFPSYLPHEVTPFQGSGNRICIAFNSWMVEKE